ncbi:unnamed protein product [Caenorhabditis angaria]|uniref:Uncharacterized protein n=1 Tax=Caenorhabditis angaria TaxID=860376 RepID=A0A9P1N273_9PELO|nr:unnamed protein product [Caenorhabditis angaria]
MMNPLNAAKYYHYEKQLLKEKNRSSTYLLSASHLRNDLSRNSTFSTYYNSSNFNVMDFFDLRKLQSPRDFNNFHHDGRMQVVSDYSLIALLPVILVAVLISGIFCVYRFRKWKHNRKQIAQLTEFYNIIESSPCLSAKHHLVQHCKQPEKAECDLISRAVSVPATGSTSFFQPIPPKTTKSIKCSGNILKAVDASEVLFHFSQFPAAEKILKKPGAIVHRV